MYAIRWNVLLLVLLGIVWYDELNMRLRTNVYGFSVVELVERGEDVKSHQSLTSERQINMEEKVMQGKPYAGNPHVRFDEGAGAPRHSGRSALLYKEMTLEERMDYAARRKSEMNCCQAVLVAFADRLGKDEAEQLRLGSGFGAGMGTMEGTCGALVGAIMVSSLVSPDGCPESSS